MACLEEGELEDGELLSSDEEEQGETTGPLKVPSSKETSKDNQSVDEVNLRKLLEQQKPSDTESNHTSPHSPKATSDDRTESKDDTEDGEIFSDDEEAVYYPQHVRSRPPREGKARSDQKHSDGESQKSDSESLSGVRSGRSSRDRREKERNLRSSPESETDYSRSTVSDTRDRGVFFEDRDGSGSESASSRDRTRSRSREREKDHHSSPKYGSRHGNRNRERDRSNRSRNDDDSSERGSHYSRQSSGYGRTRGGYGGYQQRGGYGTSKFQGGGGGGHGGYTSSVQPGLMNTGMTAQQFHNLALKVKKRKEDGLPLLPQPNLDKCGNLDQYNYPAPPSWYLEEVEAWEKREREEEEEKAKKEINQEEKVVEKVGESKSEVVETKTAISPLFRRTSSVALEIVSSPVSDGESPMVLADTTDSEVTKDPIPPSKKYGQSHDLLPETKVEPMETGTASEVASLVHDVTRALTVEPLRKLAANIVQTDNESKPPSTNSDDSTAMETDSIATVTVATVTTAITDSTSTLPTPQSLLDLSTSTAAESSLPTSDSVTFTKTPPTITPLTITTVVESDDQSHSPSLSPTIPIQSGSQMKGAATKLPPKTFRPKIMSDSESEEVYDDYLDQLDQEEDEVIEEDDVIAEDNTMLLSNALSEEFPLISGSSAPSLISLFEAGPKDKTETNQTLDSIGDPLSEDFPSIGKEAKKSSSNQISLMSLIGESVVSKDLDEKKSGDKKPGKGARRKQKDAMWWAKQKERDKAKQAPVTSEDLKKTLPCKYYLSGNCKNGESCSFSHDCAVPKKKEACKFYLQGYCSKGSLCHYYHETFPCKYIHTRGFCNNGDQCRFSHAPLTLETKELLISVLDPALAASLPSVLVHSADDSSLVVSIPKDAVKGLIVSIPLINLPPDNKFHSTDTSTTPGPLVSALPTHSGPIPPPLQYQPPPRAPFPFQQQSGNPVPFLSNAPSQFHAPPHAPPPNQSLPIPLFPPKQQFQPPPFPPNQAPPPPVHRLPHPPGHQRKSLLPTPPPHMMISPEELQRIENSHQQDYWEAPELTQQNPPAPFPQQQQLPPPPPTMGGAPPFNGMPPNQFGRGGFHQQGPPPHGPPPQPFPPQQPPQFGPPPGQQQPHAMFPPPGPHPPPSQQWNKQQAGGMGMRQQPGMEQNPVQPPRMDPRHNQASSSAPPFPPSRVDPRQKQMGPNPLGPPPTTMRNDMVDSRLPPPSGDPMHQPLPRGAQSWHPETGGWNPPPPTAHAGLANQPAPYHRHNGGQPHPQPHPPPPHPYQQHQHSFGAQPPNMGAPGAPGLPPYQQPHVQGPPYHTHNTAGAMSPPQQPMGGAIPAQAPPISMDKRSPVWGMSPEYSGSQSPGGGGVSSPTGGEIPRRRDPRTKYAHLKIKSKGQSSNSQPILKRGAGEAGVESPAPGFKIPKLLQDTSNLNRPLDPRELFGSKDALSGGEEEYGEITAPFGAFRSMFAQPQPSEADGSSADSAGTSQQFGEITMGAAADPSPAKAKESNEEAQEKATIDSSSEMEDKKPKDQSITKPPSEVPSYIADLNMGLGTDLKIDSAFGSLSEKTSKGEDSSEASSGGHDSQARKLPSIFGFS